MVSKAGAKPRQRRVAIGLHHVQPVHRAAQDDDDQPVIGGQRGEGHGRDQRAGGGRASKGKHLAAEEGIIRLRLPSAPPEAPAPPETLDVQKLLSRVKCYECVKRGHVRKDCSDNKRSSSSSSSGKGRCKSKKGFRGRRSIAGCAVSALAVPVLMFTAMQNRVVG